MERPKEEGKRAGQRNVQRIKRLWSKWVLFPRLMHMEADTPARLSISAPRRAYLQSTTMPQHNHHPRLSQLRLVPKASCERPVRLRFTHLCSPYLLARLFANQLDTSLTPQQQRKRMPPCKSQQSDSSLTLPRTRMQLAPPPAFNAPTPVARFRTFWNRSLIIPISSAIVSSPHVPRYTCPGPKVNPISQLEDPSKATAHQGSTNQPNAGAEADQPKTSSGGQDGEPSPSSSPHETVPPSKEPADDGNEDGDVAVEKHPDGEVLPPGWTGGDRPPEFDVVDVVARAGVDTGSSGTGMER